MHQGGGRELGIRPARGSPRAGHEGVQLQTVIRPRESGPEQLEHSSGKSMLRMLRSVFAVLIGTVTILPGCGISLRVPVTRTETQPAETQLAEAQLAETK